MGDGREADLELLVGGDVVGHLSAVVGLVGVHVEVTRAGEAEEDRLLLAGLGALACLLHGLEDRVRALRCRQDGLETGEVLGCLEDVGLLHGNGLHVTIVLEFGDDGAHAMVAQAACMVGGGQKAAAQRVHLDERAGLARVGEVVGILAAGE